ncbi:hypothetical protein [Sphingorhabdus sp. Alg239-R122]|uniref:hypothetical protein n=1 Tax=Sphingorhabdus sp. Alg239-R122 TaxID=2305989 RepID=UPI0013DA1D52|nr:hypothetical protein [Sphingorhabdus sp. Alg239-R122]
MSSFLNLLKEQGVDVDDDATIADFGLHLDLTDGKRWFNGSAASSAIITITE